MLSSHGKAEAVAAATALLHIPHSAIVVSSSSIAAVLRQFSPRFAPLFHPASPVLVNGGGVEMAGLA